MNIPSSNSTAPNSENSGRSNGAAPSLNQRFATYLDNALPLQERQRRWEMTALLLGIALLLTGAALALFRSPLYLWATLPVGIYLVTRGAMDLRRKVAARRHLARLRNVARRGVPVTAYLVQANAALFRPGRETLPCLVLFSFQPEVDGDQQYMRWLARRVYSLKNTQQPDTDGRFVANLVSDERAVPYRRRTLPLSFTDGSIIYCADLWIKRAYLPSGYLTSSQISCIAELGASGGIELVPHWIVRGNAGSGGGSDSRVPQDGASATPPNPLV